jgi:hypothetical protein
MFVEGQEILEKRYKVIKRLGGGAFGEIYRGNLLLSHRSLEGIINVIITNVCGV